MKLTPILYTESRDSEAGLVPGGQIRTWILTQRLPPTTCVTTGKLPNPPAPILPYVTVLDWLPELLEGLKQ